MHSVKLLIQIPAWITSTDFESDHILTRSPENVSQNSASDAGVSYHQVSALKKISRPKQRRHKQISISLLNAYFSSETIFGTSKTFKNNEKCFLFQLIIST